MNYPSIETRLEKYKLVDQSTNCWLWIGDKIRIGYGRIWFRGKTRLVHRVSAHLYFGLDIDDSNTPILHKIECPNRNCFNPQHLKIGTLSENIQDSVKLKTHPQARKDKCPKCGGLYFIGITRTGIRKDKTYRKCRFCIKQNKIKRENRI